MRIKILIFITLIFATGLYLIQRNSCVSSSDFMQYDLKKVFIGNKYYCLYIADTDTARESGLSNKTIKPNEGMVFTFERAGYYHFWMKDMLYPLDFVYINNGVIVDYKENILPSTYPKSFTSTAKADKIIELRAGEIKNSDIKKDEKIIF